MRPVRFVALSEDGQAFVLADEVGRLLALPIDERVAAAARLDRSGSQMAVAPPSAAGHAEPEATLSPRDIQARIRSGESAEDVARVAGVPVDRVLRYAGPVLQERAMLAQHARRTKLRTAERGGSTLADVVDGRLAQHGVDGDKIAWDAYRRDDGTWRIVATWPSGKATAQAIWDLDKGRQTVSPHDDMAQYLCAERPTQILGQEPAPERSMHERGGHGLPGPSRAAEPGRGGHGLPAAGAEAPRPNRDPIRAGREALLASLDRPLEQRPTPAADTRRPVAGGAAALLGGGAGSAFDDDSDLPKEVPAVPSLAVLRPRRTVGQAGAAQQQGTAAAESDEQKPRKRLPSWDDVLFGGGPAARESS